jgi:hypothetical protein
VKNVGGAVVIRGIYCEGCQCAHNCNFIYAGKKSMTFLPPIFMKPQILTALYSDSLYEVLPSWDKKHGK